MKKKLQELLELYETAAKTKNKAHQKIAIEMANEVLRELIAGS